MLVISYNFKYVLYFLKYIVYVVHLQIKFFVTKLYF